MATLTPSPKMQFFDANGNPLVGGKLYTYAAGTTTPLATYTDSTGGTPNTNPVILNARGEASVWLGSSMYYMELKDSADALIWTADNISSFSSFIQSGSGAVFRTVQSKLRDFISVLDFGADSSGITSSVTAFQNAIDSTTNSGIQVIHVPRGTYLGDMTTLSYGSRTVVWHEEGGVTYTTNSPSVSSCVRFNALRAGDTTRPWFEGRIGVHSGTGQTSSSDFANLRVDRVADYTGGVSGNVSNAFRVETTVASTVGAVGEKKPEWAITGKITSNSVNANAVALTGQAVRAAGVDTAVWSGQFNTIDNQNGTAGATYVARSIEANISANGIDATNTRSVIDAIAHNTAAVYAGGVDNIGFGVRVYSASSDFKVGFATQSNGASKILTGIQNGATGTTGYSDVGTWSGFAMNIASTAAVGLNLSSGTFSTIAMRLGTDKKIGLTNSDTAWVGYTTATGGVEIGVGSAVQAAVGSGMKIGAPTGSFKGAGTLNVAGDIYKNNTAYTNPDYVFEKEYTGSVVKFINNPGASSYAGRKSIREIEEITKTTFRLPGFGDNPAGAFERFDMILEKLEEAYLCIFELNSRLEKLESK